MPLSAGLAPLQASSSALTPFLYADTNAGGGSLLDTEIHAITSAESAKMGHSVGTC